MIGQMLFLSGRAIREPVVQTILAMVSVPTTEATARALGLNPGLEPGSIESLSSGLFDPRMWQILAFAAVFGGLGGVVAELISLHGNIELPHRKRVRNTRRWRLADPHYEIDLGIISRILLGATAGLAVLAIYSPTTPTGLVVNGLIAGSAATGLFRLLQGRMLGKGQSSEPRAGKPAVKPQLSLVGGAQSSTVAH